MAQGTRSGPGGGQVQPGPHRTAPVPWGPPPHGPGPATPKPGGKGTGKSTGKGTGKGRTPSPNPRPRTKTGGGRGKGQALADKLQSGAVRLPACSPDEMTQLGSGVAGLVQGLGRAGDSNQPLSQP